MNLSAASSTVSFCFSSTEKKMLITTSSSGIGWPSRFATLRAMVGVMSLWKPFNPPCGRVLGVTVVGVVVSQHRLALFQDRRRVRR